MEEKLEFSCSKEEELLKENIFSVYSGSLNEPNRQQVFLGQLSGLIFNWCRDYLNFNIDNLGVEIVIITKRLLKEKSKANIPYDKEGFIKYILMALKRGKNEYIRSYETKNHDDVIRMKESYLGRRLTEDEKDNVITSWFEHEIAEDTNVDYLINSNTAIILEAIKTVLDKKQARARDCYRALLTLHCIDNVDLYPALDSQIIEACQQATEKPKQYELYQKYHPEASKNGSEAMASKNLKELLNDIEAYLKEKNPEFFH